MQDVDAAVLVDASGVGSLRLLDDVLGRIWFDPVLPHVFGIPLVPPEVHRPSSGSHLSGISSIRNYRGFRDG
jgi:hypothetical protein